MLFFSCVLFSFGIKIFVNYFFSSIVYRILGKIAFKSGNKLQVMLKATTLCGSMHWASLAEAIGEAGSPRALGLGLFGHRVGSVSFLSFTSTYRCKDF